MRERLWKYLITIIKYFFEDDGKFSQKSMEDGGETKDLQAMKI
jgi:hypothetical protein